MQTLRRKPDGWNDQAPGDVIVLVDIMGGAPMGRIAMQNISCFLLDSFSYWNPLGVLPPSRDISPAPCSHDPIGWSRPGSICNMRMMLMLIMVMMMTMTITMTETYLSFPAAFWTDSPLRQDHWQAWLVDLGISGQPRES